MNKTIILSIDALQTEDLKVLAGEPVFSGILEKAAVVENVREVYPTLTNVNHVSIITGVTPDRHGICHNMIPYLPSKDINWNMVGRNWFWHRDSIKVPTLVDAAMEKGCVTASIAWPSMGGPSANFVLAEVWPLTKKTIKETYGASCTQNVMDLYYDKFIAPFDFKRSIDNDSFCVPIAADIIRNFKPDLILIHLIYVDHIRHKTGNNSIEVLEALKRMDGMVGELLEACREAGMYDHTNFFIVGDHGQMDIREIFNMNTALKEHKLLTTNGDGNVLAYEAYSFSAGFSAQIILRDPDDAALESKVFQVLRTIQRQYPHQIQRIYTKEEAQAEECLSGDFSFVVEAAEGVCFENTIDGPVLLSSDASNHRLFRANHGYHPSKGPKPPLVAFGPDIREGTVIHGASILDECPTFAKVMGLDMQDLMGRPLDIFKKQADGGIDANARRINLSGVYNMRDLGGYPIRGGGVTKRGVFYRADSLHGLTDADVAQLRDIGITAQIDLRSEPEVSGNPSKLSGANGFTYHTAAFIDDMSSGFMSLPGSLSELYSNLLDNHRGRYANVFRKLISEEGPCVFNCTLGKDRTGTVAMLLLKLAGVTDEAIIADYSVSADNMKVVLEKRLEQFRRDGIKVPDYLYESKPEDMEATLLHLEQNYSGAEEYLKACGLSEKEILALKQKMIEEVSGGHACI